MITVLSCRWCTEGTFIANVSVALWVHPRAEPTPQKCFCVQQFLEGHLRTTVYDYQAKQKTISILTAFPWFLILILLTCCKKIYFTLGPLSLISSLSVCSLDNFRHQQSYSSEEYVTKLKKGMIDFWKSAWWPYECHAQWAKQHLYECLCNQCCKKEHFRSAV